MDNVRNVAILVGAGLVGYYFWKRSVDSATAQPAADAVTAPPSPSGAEVGQAASSPSGAEVGQAAGVVVDWVAGLVRPDTTRYQKPRPPTV
jgi:hypothetical protein